MYACFQERLDSLKTVKWYIERIVNAEKESVFEHYFSKKFELVLKFEPHCEFVSQWKNYGQPGITQHFLLKYPHIQLSYFRCDVEMMSGKTEWESEMEPVIINSRHK